MVHTKNIVYPLCVCERASSFILVFVQKLIRYTSFPFTIIIIPRFFFFLSFFLSFYLFIFLVRRRAAPPGLWLLSKLMRRIRFFFLLVGLQLEYGEKTETLSSAPSLSSICACYYILCIHFFFLPFSPLMPLEDTEFFLVRL